MWEKQPQFRAVTRGVLTNVQSQHYVTGRAIDTLGPSRTFTWAQPNVRFASVTGRVPPPCAEEPCPASAHIWPPRTSMTTPVSRIVQTMC
jgi:hypothetical protein